MEWGGPGGEEGGGGEGEEDFSKAKSMYICSMSLVHGTSNTYRCRTKVRLGSTYIYFFVHEHSQAHMCVYMYKAKYLYKYVLVKNNKRTHARTHTHTHTHTHTKQHKYVQSNTLVQIRVWYKFVFE